MSQSSQCMINPVDAMRILVTHRLRWVVPTVIITAAAAGYAFLRTPVWEASQPLLVRDEAAGSLMLLATAACLVAGRFAEQLATASALRWGLALAMLVGSAAIWQRRRLRYACRRLGAVIDVGRRGPGICRAVVWATTAAPVLLLTVAASLIQITGTSPGGQLELISH